MKVFAKPISSPGRTDEFPPPLMIRFPRSKSKRGSRSRANPMSIRRITAANDTNLEPSSPKVTCVGQVRARRSKNKLTTTTTAFRCYPWLPIPKLESKCFRRVWRTSLSFLRCDYGGKSKKLQESKRIEGDQNWKREIEDVIVADDQVLNSESPPRNAFLLTRSRSAPYRSSKNWDVTMEKTGNKLAENIPIEEEIEAINGKFGIKNGEDEGSINGVEEFKSTRLNLSRCKSVPARTGDKLSNRVL